MVLKVCEIRGGPEARHVATLAGFEVAFETFAAGLCPRRLPFCLSGRLRRGRELTELVSSSSPLARSPNREVRAVTGSPHRDRIKMRAIGTDVQELTDSVGYARVGAKNGI